MEFGDVLVYRARCSVLYREAALPSPAAPLTAHPSQNRKVTYQMIQYLIPDDSAHLKALLARDRVDDHVAMNADEVLAVEDGVLVLAGGVDDLDGEVLVAVADDFAEGVLDGGVVGVDEVAVDVLDCEGGFAWDAVCVSEGILLSGSGGEGEGVGCAPTDLLPTMAILRCFCCGAIVAAGGGVGG